MSIGDVFLDKRYALSQPESCDHFTIQITDPDPNTGEILFCQTSSCNPNWTFTAGPQGESYNLPTSASKFRYATTIYMDEDGVLSGQYEEFIDSNVRQVFQIPDKIVKEIIDCIKNSPDVLPVKTNMLL